MNKYRTKYMLAAVMLWLLAAGCSAPLPTATPVPPQEPVEETAMLTVTPRETATSLPAATTTPPYTPAPTPLPTATPSAGYYRHPELGFWFNYPVGWFTEETGRTLPAVIISDADDPVQLWAGASAIEETTNLEAFTQHIKDELGLGENIELVSDEPTTLDQGTLAREFVLRWQNGDGDPFMAHGFTAVSGLNGYVILLTGRQEIIESRPQTAQAIARGLHLEQPEVFGVSRENALFLLAPEPQTFDPALSDEGLDGIGSYIFSGLTRLNDELQIEPDLAESWDIGLDGTVYTFYLREDAVFHDGRSVTASSVKKAWERALDPVLASPTAPLYLGDIVSIEATDDLTLVVTLDSAKPYFLAKLTHPVAFITHPQNALDSDALQYAPIGSGPFIFQRWEPDQVIILEANNDYYGIAPQIETVVFINGNASFSAYESGLVDYTAVSPFNLSRARDPGEPLSADLISGNLLCTQRVLFDVTQAPFDDPNIRRAFSLAVDRQQLAQLVLKDAAVPAVGVLPPGMPGYTERPFDSEFNIEEAQALIAQSSYGSADALPPLVLAAAGAGIPDEMTTALADMWVTNLNISLETRLITTNEYEGELPNRPGNMFITTWCADYPDPENMLDLLYHSDSSANYGGYTNDEVDALLEAARTEQDTAARLAFPQ